MTTLALASVITQLVSLATTSCPTAKVIDGPPLEEGTEALAVYIGADVDENADLEAASLDITWAYIGRPSDEQGSVRCAISAWTGNSSFSAPRTAALDALSAIQTAIGSDPSLNNTVVWVRSTESVQVKQTRDGDGCRVVVPFVINYQARP